MSNKCNKKLPNHFPSKIIPGLDRLDPQMQEQVAQNIYLKMQQRPGMTLQEATGLADTTLEGVYHLAHSFYNQGKYQESVSLFQFLAGLSPTTYKFVLGCAASYHQMGIYDEATLGFSLALYLEPENPLPAYYIMDSCLHQGLYEEAKEAAQIAIECCGTHPEHAALKERCRLTLEKLNP